MTDFTLFSVALQVKTDLVKNNFFITTLTYHIFKNDVQSH